MKIRSRVMKKVTALFIAILMVLSIFGTGYTAFAAEPAAVAAWDYTAAAASAAVPATSGALLSGAVLTNFKDAVPTYSSNSLSISGWDNGADTKYWQLSLSTKGYENLTLSAKTRSSGTGPRDFKAIYSTDNGTTWNDVPVSAYAITGTGLSNYMPSLSLPAGTANADNLLIRFIMTSNISSRAGTGTYSATETVASGGTSNINNVIVSGTPITIAEAVGAVVAVPAGGAVMSGSKVALNCSTDGAAIMYSLNDGTFTQYDPTAQITLSTLPVTLKAYGAKDGMTDGEVSTWNYTQVQTALVSANPNGGAVALNQQVTLSCATPGAAIKYSFDDGANWNDYTSPIALSTLPAIIKAYAAAAGYLDSKFSTFSYIKIAGPEDIASWDYTAVPASASIPATSGTLLSGAVLTNFKNVTPTYSTSSLSIGGWDNGADTKYWQLSLSAKGYENLTLSAKMRSSGTGPRDFKVIYSTDNGTAWNDIMNSTYAITGTSLNNYMPTLSLPGDTANTDNLLIRFIMASNISSRAGTGTYSATETVASGGTSNINNVIVSGTPISNTSAVGAVEAVPEGGTIILGSKVSLTCATDGAVIFYSLNDDPFAQYDSTAQITLSTLPATLKAYGTKGGMTDGTVSTWNYTQAQAALVSANPNGGAVALNKQVTLFCSTPGTVIKYSLDDGANWSNYTSAITLSTLPATIKAYAVAEGYLNGEISAFSFTKKEAGVYNIYFGQLHSHTNYSDGIGTPDDAYSHAKNVAKVDFLAVTDHSNSLDNAATATMANGSNSSEWINGHGIADKYTDSSFVGIYGFEMTWSNGTGHINTFNTPGFETRENQVYKNADGLQQYYNVLKNYPNSISQFNHPGPTFGDFNDFANYDPVIDNQISLIEVGNGEGDIGSGGYFPSYEYYTRALDKGWHISPTNNQDNHQGNWGDSNTARTVVLADSLTRDNIYDAMKNMRTYATEDNDLRIKYTLNGEVMGTILDQKPDGVDIKVDLEDPDNEALGKVSVISNGGKVVASQTLNTSKDTVEFILEPDYSYYYIRVDEADKDIAVTAPVWIGEVDKAGISKTTGSTAMPLKGEKLTVTTGLYNNESAPMNIESLVYSINGTTINEAPVLNPVSTYGTGSYSFDYIPDKSGKYNIDVRLTATINGIERIFTDVLALDVTDPALVTKVMVDASHYNDYVSGYYAGNMTNLITLANGEKINVILQKDTITDDALRNIQLLILAPPAKKAGTVSGVAYPASPYTDDEIAAIKRYANNGGNIIVTALADYQDSRTDLTNHSAYQQNLILAAIGAGTRINDDEVIDYDNNPNANNTKAGGTYGIPYRVPMNVYNMASTYLNGVVPQQNYSFYSGCSITPGSNATWLVKGTPTTYGFDSDNDRLGGSFVSSAASTIPADTGIGKGNVVALAEETLPGGGKLFVGGTVFYSNFEIKVQLDNAGQFQNSNYNITMNILDSIKRVISVSPISQARSAQLGDVYCVEGTVTAGKIPADNAFFDTLYIQDATGGINLFPVSGADIMVGQKVKAIGTVDEYQGDRELRVIEYSVTDTSVNPVEPTIMATKDAMDSKNGGKLIKIEGTVTRMDSQNIYVDDGSGEARAFVDGYIGDGSGDTSKAGKWDPMIQAGDRVNITGLASVDPSGARLRVRNTSEILRIPDTVPPVVTIAGVVDGGLYNTDITPIVTTDEGTLVMTLNGNNYGGEIITAEGAYTLIATAVDRDGNKMTRTISFTIDKTAPVITVTGITNGEAVKLNQNVTVTWSASDALSSVETSEGDIVSGGAIDTSKPGAHILNFTSTDKAGNTVLVSIIYHVQYIYSGILKPLENDGTSSSKQGSTVPVKFWLKNAYGTYVTNAKTGLYLAIVVDGIAGAEFEAESTSKAAEGNAFRYDTDGQYIFNLNTKSLTKGVYRLRIDLGDGTTNTVILTLR